MAATTSGWQWPVEVTAMPAEKSRNSFPSTSSTMTPRPRFATIGYERVYEGEMNLLSPERTRLALGPGNAVLMLGPATAIFVVMTDLPISWSGPHASQLGGRMQDVFVVFRGGLGVALIASEEIRAGM